MAEFACNQDVLHRQRVSTEYVHHRVLTQPAILGFQPTMNVVTVVGNVLGADTAWRHSLGGEVFQTLARR